MRVGLLEAGVAGRARARARGRVSWLMLVIGLAACSPVAPGGADARPVDGADTPPVDASLVDTPLVDAMAPDTPPGLVICHFDLDTFGNGCVFGN